jgi:hypothetical protein
MARRATPRSAFAQILMDSYSVVARRSRQSMSYLVSATEKAVLNVTCARTGVMPIAAQKMDSHGQGGGGAGQDQKRQAQQTSGAPGGRGQDQKGSVAGQSYQPTTGSAAPQQSAGPQTHGLAHK